MLDDKQYLVVGAGDTLLRSRFSILMNRKCGVATGLFLVAVLGRAANYTAEKLPLRARTWCVWPIRRAA